MIEVIGVRFKKVGKVYYFDPCGTQVTKGTDVIVETSRGVEYGEAVMGNRQVEEDSIIKPLKKFIRIATPADKQVMEQNAKFEKEAFKICEEKIAKHKLEMKLVTVEYTFDHSKMLFYFSADGRVDFRELVKDLASVFRTRIELRQIGVRDEAKMIGGLGVCGCTLCCNTFLDDFQPVSINMAKDQGLSLNPSKISGTCGRLMCCLKYENEAYQELIAKTPPVESLVEIPQGRGTIMDVSLLKGCCKVRLMNDPDTPVTVSCEECKVLRYGKDREKKNEQPGEQQAKDAAKKPEHAERRESERREVEPKDGDARESKEAAPRREHSRGERRERRGERGHGERREHNRRGERPVHHEGRHGKKENQQPTAPAAPAQE